ncbi:hypothetical protein Cgig2_016397 [Carnegiea gigantea]|uniref:Uncharacterized protein n=1 Tax=Carnegiea gigantea TaxID=171969 RepID=A0A9Q1K960_9CARY|nr:hypothetical protein Cgig2_016397 [Carnegiea gigantea]
MNGKELLRKTVYIIDHLRPLCELVPRAVEILGVTSNSYTKEKPLVSPSEKGKTKVSGGNKRPQNKRTPKDQSPTMENSCDQSPIEVNFKRARHDRPTQSDDSDMSDDIRFEDLPIADLDTFTEQETLNQQDAPTDKVGVPLHEAANTAIEHHDAVVTTIIPIPDTSDGLVKAVPIQSIPTSLASLLCNLKEDWVQESILKGVELSTIEICRLSSKIKEIFGIVETAIKIEELVDVDRVKALFDQYLTCSSEIAHIEDQLNNLSSKASKLKVKEQEVLREESGFIKCERI